uniref:NADP-dependent oxidoreductase domain-containing protein n=1 Tax=Aegilops tauschii subsp. strangulata TaxID=200361 RepID=A0A452Z902_AEGTS
MAGSFVLNTGARMPSVGLGTWQIDPDVVGDAIYAAVKVFSCRFNSFLMVLWLLDIKCSLHQARFS